MVVRVALHRQSDPCSVSQKVHKSIVCGMYGCLYDRDSVISTAAFQHLGMSLRPAIAYSVACGLRDCFYDRDASVRTVCAFQHVGMIYRPIVACTNAMHWSCGWHHISCQTRDSVRTTAEFQILSIFGHVVRPEVACSSGMQWL